MYKSCLILKETQDSDIGINLFTNGATFENFFNIPKFKKIT